MEPYTYVFDPPFSYNPIWIIESLMSKSRKELKENELAGAITDQFDHIKPHLPKILIGVFAIVAIVFGINALLSSRSAAKEAKSIKLVLFGVENSAAGSLSRLDEQIEDFPDEGATAWAHLLKADRELTSGLDKIFVDKLAGRDFVQRSLKSFEKAEKAAGENQLVKTRALFGWARALESLGLFDDAAAKYAEVSKLGDTPFKSLAEKGIARVNNPFNQEFYILFNERENNTIVQGGPGAGPNESAPQTNSGLPARPDFTYPGEEIVPGSNIDENGAPKSDPGKGTGEKKKKDASPVPPENVINEKSADKEQEKAEKNTLDQPKGKGDSNTEKKAPAKTSDPANNTEKK